MATKETEGLAAYRGIKGFGDRLQAIAAANKEMRAALELISGGVVNPARAARDVLGKLDD